MHVILGFTCNKALMEHAFLSVFCPNNWCSMVPPLSQTVKAGTRDTRETTVMVLVGLVVMRISKMGNLVRIGKLGSYLFLQIVYFFQIFFNVLSVLQTRTVF
jgi:hypothetical protein